MLKSFSLSKNNVFYYDVEKKTIGRFPSKSNLLSHGSDNSLYFGMTKNKDIVNVFCNFFEVKNISEIHSLNYDMKCGEEDVNVVVNINKEGQIQIKIMKDGTMARLADNYAFSKMTNFDFSKLLLVVDFLNKEIRFKDPIAFVL